MQLSQYVVFKIGKEMYAMNIGFVERIENDKKIRPVPNTNKSDVKGIINIQEEIVPVVDLRITFSLESEKINDIPFIIVSRIKDKNEEDIVVGLVVDEVVEVIDIEENEINKGINGNIVGNASEYIQGVYRKEKEDNEREEDIELIIILNANKLLGVEVLEEMKDLKE